MKRLRWSELWKDPDFLKLWTGQTISVFGSNITLLALPLTAILVLDATPAQMGLLGAAGTLPHLLVGLFAGVWADRVRRRPIMIAADLGRALMLLTVPLAWVLGLLHIEQLYVVAFLAGILTTFFDVGYGSYLPSLVGREHLVEGNSKLHASQSVAEAAGPGLAGALVQLLSAPIVVIVDVVTFVASALALTLIRKPEPEPAPRREGKNLWREIGEGLHIVLSTSLLRSLAVSGVIFVLFQYVLLAVYTLYLTRELGIEPALLGVIFGIGALGALSGAVIAGQTARRFGLGPTIIAAPLLGCVAALLIPLAGGLPSAAVPLLVMAQFLYAFGGPIFTINAVSLRQSISPDRLLGRVNASNRFMVFGVMPVGSLLGGFLGETIGLRPTLAVAALGMLLAFVWLVASPVRSLRELPARAAETTVVAT